MAMKRDAAPAGQLPGGVAAPRAGFLEGLGALYAFLVETSWEDGKKRETATLTLFAEDGLWKWCLHDRDSGRTGWVSDRDPLKALAILDGDLALNAVDWRKRQKSR